MTKIKTKFTADFLIKMKSTILILGLRKGHPSYTTEAFSKQKNIQHSMKFINIFYFCGSFLPFWIRIQPTNINADPEPATLLTGTLNNYMKGWVLYESSL
jgi:hypothetical protein